MPRLNCTIMSIKCWWANIITRMKRWYIIIGFHYPLSMSSPAAEPTTCFLKQTGMKPITCYKHLWGGHTCLTSFTMHYNHIIITTCVIPVCFKFIQQRFRINNKEYIATKSKIDLSIVSLKSQPQSVLKMSIKENICKYLYPVGD